MNYSQNNIHELHKSLYSNLKTVNAQQEAWWILEHTTGKKRSELLAQKNISLTTEEQSILTECVRQITIEHKPLQYILGSVPFCDLEIKVEPPILIPRPETEEWCTWLIDQLKAYSNQNLQILDLCCGTGCISLALAKALPKSTVIGIDINTQAIALSEKNKLKNKIENIKFIQSDLYENIPEKSRFDLIVSNPPYIREAEYEKLEKSVTDWEDKSALVADENGLEFYKEIIEGAHLYLKDDSSISSRIVLEFGLDQAEQIKNSLLEKQFDSIEIHRDAMGKERWVSANKTQP
jgi:release factor glutamine methyltransferase